MSRLMIIFLMLVSFGVSAQDKPDKTHKEGTNAVLINGTENDLFFMGYSTTETFSDVKEHTIMLSPFYITETEITNNEFLDFISSVNVDRKGYYKGTQLINLNLSSDIYWLKNKFYIKEGQESHPVVYVTWYGANEYCRWRGGRLPTEAEWEYAAKGGMNEQKYSGSDNPDKIAWYNVNSEGGTQPVRIKTPNGYGLYDMSGNVMEWVNDYYSKSYNTSKIKDPIGPRKTKFKVTRGGAWNRGADFLSTVKRHPLNPGYTDSNLGFRCVLIK